MARIYVEQRDDGEALRRLAALLEDPGGQGECVPPMDVVEHEDRVEITLDLPGVPRDGIRVVYTRGAVVVTGRKLPRTCERAIAFHLAERSFGRFGRSVTLSGAFDAGRARASLAGGVLRIVLPRVEERRGHDIPIEVTGG